MANIHVAVIGAGAAGLAATSYLLEEGLSVTLFEERHEPGGVWTNTDTKTRPNAMYDGLETNVPRTLMTFTDHKWDRNTSMFPPNKDVKSYLQSYFMKIQKTPHAQQNLTLSFDTTVDRLHHGVTRFQPKWKIEASSNGLRLDTKSFAAVVVAAGNYNDPYMTDPAEPGRQLWEGKYPGTITHSQSYQNADMYRNKNVLIVGNSASGWDISGQIAAVARKVLVSVRRPELQVNSNCAPVGVIARYSAATRTVYFNPCKGSKTHEFPNVDYVIYCTGYLYNFSFATKGSQPIFQPGFKVANLYRHMFYTKEPSLAFVGLPKMTAAFTVAEAQSAVIARAFSGRLEMPSNNTMAEWEQQTAMQRVADMRSDKTYHTLAQADSEDKQYINMLQQYATSQYLHDGHSKPPPYWCRCLDNARKLTPEIRTQYKKYSKLSDDARRYYNSYSRLGARLDIPCCRCAHCRIEHAIPDDAVTCFLDTASR